jgi:hypothetical protein
MSRAAVADLHRRLDALCEGPLSADERDELAELDADFAARFPTLRNGDPRGVYGLSDEQLEDYLEHERGRDGRAQRHYDLRMRNRTPAEIERNRIRGAMITAMSEEELEQWVAQQLRRLNNQGIAACASCRPGPRSGERCGENIWLGYRTSWS